MTDAVQVAIIVAIAPTLTSLAALISSMRNHEKISKIEAATNGMHLELVKTTADAKLAEGILEEKKRAEVERLAVAAAVAEVKNGTKP